MKPILRQVEKAYGHHIYLYVVGKQKRPIGSDTLVKPWRNVYRCVLIRMKEERYVSIRRFPISICKESALGAPKKYLKNLNRREEAALPIQTSRTGLDDTTHFLAYREHRQLIRAENSHFDMFEKFWLMGSSSMLWPHEHIRNFTKSPNE